jgi:Protein of unknown function (DUF3325)
MLLVGLLVYAGLAALCLAMDRHHRQIWQRTPGSRTRMALRVLGVCLLVGSLLASVHAAGGPLGVVAWFGILTLAGVLLVLLLPYAPRMAGVLAVIAPLAALLLVW